MMLGLSLVLALLPLLGVVWIVVYGSITTVDGLFTSLILLAMSGILGLNVLLELRKGSDQGGGSAAGAGARTASGGLVHRGTVKSVQFFEALVGQPNKSIVMLSHASASPHMVVLEGDVRNALPVGQKVEIILRKAGESNVLVSVSYA